MNVIKFVVGYLWNYILIIVHKIRVFRNIIIITKKVSPEHKWELYKRGLKHDLSKYRWSENRYFAELIFDLKKSTYGSEKYNKMLEIAKKGVNNHYCKNSHHPEYYKNGIEEMSEIDKLEMIADWEAATKKHNDGNIYKSIEINKPRFNYDDETKDWLVSIANILV